MARKTHEQLLKQYRSKLDQSKKWRKDEDYDDLWTRMIGLYRGKHYETVSKEDRLLVNIAFATINVIWPGVSVAYPKIIVSARKFADAARAITIEVIVNYWWKHYKFQKEFRRAVKDSLIIGHGWIKTGYRFVEDEQETYETADEMAALSPESVTESDTIITEDRPFVERVSPFDMYVDADATSMSDMTWIAQRIKRTLEAVKSDKRYAPSVRSEVTPSHYSKWSNEESKGGWFRRNKPQDPGDGYVEIWEYYDIETGQMCVFCEGSDKFLVAPMDIPFSFGHPFVFIPDYEVPDYFYPMGELEQIECLQQELNKTRTQMMNHRKKFARKWLFRGSAFDATGREALLSDEDNRMVEVKSQDPLADVVVAMPAVISPPEFYNQSGMIINDIDRITAISEYQRAALPEIRRTATEAGIIQDAANARASDKLATIEAAIGETAGRLVAMSQEFMTTDQTVRINGGQDENAWMNFDRDYLQGEFDFEVEAGSTQPVNESFRRQSAMQVMDAMSAFIPLGFINAPQLAMYVLQYGFGVKNPSQFVMLPVGPDGEVMDPNADPNAQEGAPMESLPPGM